MELKITQTELTEIREFRNLFLLEINAQFICNKCHDYGWADVYLVTAQGIKIGYGAVWGTHKRTDRDTIFEFFIIKTYRKFANLVFQQFQAISKTIYIECQSNDPLLSPLLYEQGKNINAEAILFEDHFETAYLIPGVIFRKREDKDEMGEDDSDYVLIKDKQVLASGGLMLNYNFPYADIYMQVKEGFRGNGLGTLMVQELKKLAYSMGRVPAARCNINNNVSKATLLKAGFKVCGFRLKGELL